MRPWLCWFRHRWRVVNAWWPRPHWDYYAVHYRCLRCSHEVREQYDAWFWARGYRAGETIHRRSP